MRGIVVECRAYLGPVVVETWSPIEDLNEPVEDLEVAELRALDALWREQRDALERSDALGRFRERLARSWAIETGVIEQVYDLDRGTTELLIEHGLRAELISRASTSHDPTLVIQMIRDHRDVIDGIFDFIARRRELSTSYVKELHAALTRHQQIVDGVDELGNPVQAPLLHGEWKRLPNNPSRPDGTTHQYAPPEHVDSEMDRLVAMHLAHDREGVPPEVEAAFLHHRFTQIHPFQDGNGRVARALATLVLLRAGWFPLTVDRDRKPEYLDALEAADLGTLRYLSRLIGGLQRQALVQALGMGDQSQREQEGIDQIIRAARDKVMGPTIAVDPNDLATAIATANHLVERGSVRLGEIREKLQRELVDYSPQLDVFSDVEPEGSQRAKWHRAAVIRHAKQLGYFANLDTYAAWLRLRLRDRNSGTANDIIIDLHGIGSTFRGLIAATAFWEAYDLDDGRWQRTERRLLHDEVFQINPREPEASVEERFSEWLDHQVTAGLAIWERGLTGSL
jgi:Fic family protein